MNLLRAACMTAPTSVVDMAIALTPVYDLFFRARKATACALAHRSLCYIDGPVAFDAREAVRTFAGPTLGGMIDDVSVVDADTASPFFGSTLLFFQRSLSVAAYVPIDENEPLLSHGRELGPPSSGGRPPAEESKEPFGGSLLGGGCDAADERGSVSAEDSPRSGGEGDISTLLKIRQLPSTQLCGLWSSLHYSGGLKQRLLRYASSSAELSRTGASSMIVNRSGLILMHGPPGSGKSSLARALAQKLAIWHVGGGSEEAIGDDDGMDDASLPPEADAPSAMLYEINAAACMSKFFGKSSKTLQRAFDRVRDDLRARPNTLAVVLVDEADAIAISRAHSLNAADPGDAARVTGTLLRELDALAELPGTLVLATSNLAGDLNGAFVDRADLSERVGNPEVRCASCAAVQVKRRIQVSLLTRAPGCCSRGAPVFIAARALRNSSLRGGRTGARGACRCRYGREAAAAAGVGRVPAFAQTRRVRRRRPLARRTWDS